MTLNLGNLSVLVVEDTLPMRKLIVSVLSALEVGKVLHADNGEQGFDLFRRENPDIVLADWQMAGMDGIALTREIRTNMLSPNRFAPVILVTGYSAMSRVAQARDAGVTEFMIKPFSAGDLARRLAYVVNRPRDFVDHTRYFGPDRRRRRHQGYRGAYRRLGDAGLVDIDFE